ncbi:MAG: hypothetical protein ACHQ03_06195 [Candidatus Bathyarchaeia archaeon]
MHGSGGYAPVITINTPDGLRGLIVADSRITEPIAFALQAFALFADEVEIEWERTTTVPLSADMGPVKSAIRLTFDIMSLGSTCEVDRLVAIMITLRFGGKVVELSA